MTAGRWTPSQLVSVFCTLIMDSTPYWRPKGTNDRHPILYDHSEENVLLHSSRQSWSVDRATGIPFLSNSNQHTGVSLTPNILGKGEMGRKCGMQLMIVRGHTHTHTHTHACTHLTLPHPSHNQEGHWDTTATCPCLFQFCCPL